MLGYEVTPRQLNISIEQSESRIVGWSNNASYGSSQAEVKDTESMVGMNVTEAWTESVGSGSVDGGALNDKNLTEGLGWSESVEDSQDGEGVTEGLDYRNRTGIVDWVEVGFLAVEVGVMKGGVMGRGELYGSSARHGM